MHLAAACRVARNQSFAMARVAKQSKKTEPAGRSLAQAITAAPVLSEPAQAHKKVAAWLAGIARTETGKALKRLLASSEPVRSLVEGLADGSPYLWKLAASEPARLLALLQDEPERHLEAVLSRTRDA